jgi:hypothetical protein
MNDGRLRWLVSARLAFAVGACSWGLTMPACFTSDNGGSPDSGSADGSTTTDSGAATADAAVADTGGGSEASSLGDSGAEAGIPPDALSNSDAKSASYDSGCLALVADAATYVPNPDGDQCINAPPASCFNKFAGVWNCEPTNSGNRLLINTNGYFWGSNGVGQVYEGCVDCSGNFTDIGVNLSAVDVGTLTLNDGGPTASFSENWNDCSGSMLQDVQACKQATTSYPNHSNCTLAVSCAGP